MCRIRIKVWATVVATDAMNLKNCKEWFKAIESELKSARATTGSDVAVVLRSVLIRLKKQGIVVGTKKVHCHERMENQYEERNIVGTS